MSSKNAPSRPPDVWANGEGYERYVGRWSRQVAREFVSWLTVPDGGRWLDVGCGTGALSRTILAMTTPRAVRGVDQSAGFIAYARGRVTDDRARFVVADAQAVPAKSSAYDAVVSGLMLNFVREPSRAVAEMTRTARAGAVVAVYVWDYAGTMDMMRHFWNAVTGLDASAESIDEGRRFPICQPAALTQLFRDAGLRDVEVRAIDIATNFRDFDDYWTPFLGGQGSAPTYAMSLSPDRRAALRERIRADLPFAADGSIPMVARAWAVRGRRP